MVQEPGVKIDFLGESSEAIEFVDRIEGIEEEVGVEINEIPNTAYVVPPLKDTTLATKVRIEISSVEDKKYFQYWIKPFKLEGYEIYSYTSLMA